MRMSDLVRPCVKNLTPYVPGKPIDEVRREYGLTDIIKLASNENPLGPSPQAVEAMRAAAADVRLYPDNDCFELRQAVSRLLDVPGEQVLLGHGSDELLHNLGLAFLNPGDEVMMCSGPFSQYPFTAALMEAVAVQVPLREWANDLEAMAARLTPRTKLVFVGSPNNPTGTIVRRGELTPFLKALPEHVVLVMDEAYYEYVDDPEYPDSLALVREGRNVVVLRTFSKIYALAGLRMGYGATTPELAAAMNAVREPFNVSSLAQVAATASLADPEQVGRSKRLNDAEKARLYLGFEALGLRYTRSQANFVWVDVARDCRQVFEELLRRGVIVRTGDIFGAPTHVRVSTGLAEENERFLQALGEVLARVPAAAG
jgi:histidinol-phosphate aminotransferase